MVYEEAFYLENRHPNIRFGDIVEGCFSLMTSMKKPFFESSNQLNITIDISKYFAVMTPCCSIGKECTVGNDTLALTPIIELQSDFLKNPYLVNDFTRINRKMKPEDSMPPKRWERLSPDEKEKKMSEGMGYSFLSYFIYGGHDLFDEYELKNSDNKILTKNYMIDFKRICSIKMPQEVVRSAKKLQLSISSREELRNKLSYFFGRRPEEDALFMD